MPESNRRPRVAYLLMTADASAGTERSVFTQAAMMAADWDVSVVSLFRDAEEPFFADPQVPVEYLVDRRSEPAELVGAARRDGDDVDIDRLATARSLLVRPEWERQISGLADLALQRWFATTTADVVITTSPPLLAMAAQLAGPDQVLLAQEHRASQLRGADLAPLLDFGAQTDALVALTERTSEWLREQLAGTGVRVETIPNALSDAHTRPRSSLTAPVIASAGRLVPAKQFSHLIRAFHHVHLAHPDWRLQIFGSGPSRDSLAGLAGRLGLSDVVDFPGSVEDMESEWARASIFALSSRAEGLPLVVLEAAAAGLPLVSYDCVTGPEEIIGANENGLLVPLGDVRGLGDALVTLVESPELRRALGERAYASVGRYSEETVRARWVALVANLLRERQVGPATRFERMLGRLSDSPEPPADEPAMVEAALAASAVELPGASRLRARDYNLGRIVELLTAGDVGHVVLPTDARSRSRIAVARSSAPRVLDVLAAAEAGEPVARPLTRSGSLLAAGPTTGPSAEVALASSGVSVHWRVSDASGLRTFGAEAGCDIEWWDDAEAGSVAAPRVNAVVDRLSHEDLQRGSFSPERVALWDEVRFPIDAVFTWVDGNDPAWVARRDEFRSREVGEALNEAATGDERYRDNEELRFALRALAENAPWVRNVYLVTDRQRPAWLVEDDRLTVVDHRDLFEREDALPTFNSHAIETQLHRIDGLSEHFLYFNDDVFLAQPAEPGDYFTAGGLTKFFPSSTKVNWVPTDEAHLLAGRNVRALMERDFGQTVALGMLHTPHPLRRSVMQELRERYDEAMTRTMLARFRSPDDLSPVSSLYHHYAYLTGRAVPGSTVYRYANMASEDYAARIARLLTDNQALVFCLADGPVDADRRSEVHAITTSFLTAMFPHPSPWERPLA